MHALSVNANRTNQNNKDEEYLNNRNAFSFVLANSVWFNSVRTINNCGYGFEMHGAHSRTGSRVIVEGSMARNSCQDCSWMDKF